jgi:predicted O-methyltransferase YrrM
VFIDAEKSEYLNYSRLFEDKLHKGSVIVADNVEHAPPCLDYVRSSGKYSSKFIPSALMYLAVLIGTVTEKDLK